MEARDPRRHTPELSNFWSSVSSTGSLASECHTLRCAPEQLSGFLALYRSPPTVGKEMASAIRREAFSSTGMYSGIFFS